MKDALQKAGITGEDVEIKSAGLKKADLFEAGLTGKADSSLRRKEILKANGLPQNLSCNALLDILNHYYTKEDKVVFVIQSDGNTRAVWSGISDKEIGGYSVVEIGEFAFRDCINLKKVYLPDSVTNIGLGAFSKTVEENVQTFTNALSNANQSAESKDDAEKGDNEVGTSSDIAQFQAYLQNTNSEEEKIVGAKRKYPIQINEAIKKDFIVEWSIGNKAYWINVEDSEDGKEVYIVININHPFFKPYTNNEDFKIILEKFVISFVVAEQQAKLTSDKDGYIRASTIRHKMNEFLSKVSED